MSARAATAGGVLLHLAGVLFALVPLRAAWLSDRAVHDRAVTQLRELEEVHDKLANHAVLATHLAALRSMLDEVTRRLPDCIDGAATEHALQSAAELHGLVLGKVTWAAEYIHEGFYAERRATFVVQGTAGDFAAFVQDVLQQAAVPQIAAMTLTAGDTPHTLRASLRVTYFHYLAEIP